MRSFIIGICLCVASSNASWYTDAKKASRTFMANVVPDAVKHNLRARNVQSRWDFFKAGRLLSAGISAVCCWRWSGSFE